MEYDAGKTLTSLIGRKGLPLHTALGFAVRLADLMASVHAAGIVHGDLKPGNIRITHDGDVKLLNFGLAKTEEGRIIGTLIYVSPEQIQGKPIDERSEIFTFGCVLFEMLTGRPPFYGETPHVTVSAIINQEPVSPSEIIPDLPAELDRVVLRCLHKDPQHRWQTMSDLKVVLEDLRAKWTAKLEP